MKLETKDEKHKNKVLKYYLKLMVKKRNYDEKRSTWVENELEDLNPSKRTFSGSRADIV